MEMEATAWAINAALEQAEKRTRRERIATAALQGLMTSERTDDTALAAEWALAAADALIARLDKP